LTFSRFFFFLSVLLLCFGAAVGQSARAFQADAGTAAKTAQPPADSSEQETGDDVYRHSGSVKFIARLLHVDKETAARLFEYFNFAIVAGAILFALLKYLPKTFRANREDIQHRLADARTATEQSHQRLAAIEQRLARLDEEIAAISKQAEKDSAEDEARIKASIEAERQRITEAVSKDIAAAAGAAQRELKRFTAGLAVDRAAKKLALTDEDDRALVREFSHSLGQQARNGGKH
jgi:F-type H+-transporting ATPase subunit b